MKKKLVVLIISLLMIVGIAVIFAACSKDEGAKSITNLTYNGETITWDSVQNAKNYKIKIDNGDEAIVSQATDKVSYRYDSKGEDFDFYIEAVIKEGDDKNPTYSIWFENIGQVTEVKVEQGNFVWSALDTAESYEVMYNGQISSAKTTSYPSESGSFTFKVRALKGQAESVDGNIPYFSVWSDTITGSVLSTPQNITYDSETFRWDKVDSATGYVIKIGNEEFTTTTNSYDYIAGNQDFQISVYAVGNATSKVYDSVYSEALSYTYIAPVEGLNVVDGVLKWSASQNAVRYRIKINGIVRNEDLTTNEFSEIYSGSSYRIQILPLGSSDFYFSHWSEEITLSILRSPVVTYGDGVIRWNQVAGSAGYTLRIKKGTEVVHTVSVGEDTFVYSYPFTDAGDYLVEVKATTLGTGGVYESKYSTAYSVKRLATPTNHNIVNRPLEQNQVSVTFNAVVGAESYALLADDVEIATVTSGTTFSVDLSKMTNKTEESVVNFKIVARGKVTSNGAVLDSNVPLEFNVTKLATPQNLAISGRQLSWDSVNHTSKYVLTIDGNRTEITTTSYTITDLAAGEHTIYVQAMGNSEEVITGGFSNALSVTKLATPTSLNIVSGNLTWAQVPHATAYRVILGTQEYNADSTSFALLGYLSSINEGMGTQISVFAVGNGSDIIDSDVSATRTISKYNRPNNVKVNGDNLVWNPSSVDSINANDYTLYFRKDSGNEKSVRVTGTSYSMSNLEAGNYVVSVVANGDNIQTVDSPRSNEFNFTKLAAITSVTKSGANYTWDIVPQAVGYEIKLSRDATWTSIDTNSYTPKFTTEGEYEISIRAIGNNADIVNSEVYSFTQRVNRLTQPVQQQELTNANAFKVETTPGDNQLKITIKKYESATGYKFFIGGLERTDNYSDNGNEVSITFTMTTQNAEYKVQVQVLGGVFDESGNYLLDSNLSTEVTVKYQA